MSEQLTEFHRRVTEHLSVIYPESNCPQLADKMIAAIGLAQSCANPVAHRNHWNETDSYLISYGDSIVKKGEKPLVTLKNFMDEHLKGVVKGVHILPFFPYSSDDGFSVINFLEVNSSLGDWDDITAIAKDYDLMADLVINHMSSRSRWFENFKKCVDPGKDYFITANPNNDFSAVVRPRSSPLLTACETLEGTKHVWCTFSADQVDLNFKNPDVLLEFINIIKHYLQYGIRVFRLDAVAFLWKEDASSCVHLAQTHELIKLLRTLIEHHSPDAIIITETNVPNRENITYFGNANEAHIIYNFSLPPLLLHTLLLGDCRHLKTWMMSMPPAQAGTAYLNFIASHDGIGLRPLDGLLSEDESNALVSAVADFGGKVTYRRAREGHDKAYEINVALYSALKGTIAEPNDNMQLQRFICAHAIMFALEGIPAVYIHSLLGTENDNARVEHSGRNRSINRHIWNSDTLDAVLDDHNSHHRQVFDRILSLLAIRRLQPAFHPNATQFTLHFGTDVFAFWRQSIQRDQSIFSLNNVTNKPQTITLADINLIATDSWCDLISGIVYDDLIGKITLAPYQSLWISNRNYTGNHQ